MRFEWGEGLDEVIPRYRNSDKGLDGGRSASFSRSVRKGCRDAGEEMRGCGRRLLGKVKGLGRRGNDGTDARCGSVEPGPEEREARG